MTATFAGFFTGLSLIIAIGAQNAFVIRQGLARSHVLMVVLVCAIADGLLIALGVAGLGLIIAGLPWLLEVVRWVGVAYLAFFGLKSIRSAFRHQSLQESNTQQMSARAALLTVLGFTFLNPHVYIDTVLLLGSIGNQFGDLRWYFAGGAMLASLVWFSALGWGARTLAPLLRTPKAWMWIDLAIAGVMFSIAILLALYRF